MIYSSVTQLVGRTPLLELTNYERIHSLKTKILAKLEYFNPTGSVKDRTAKAMIEDAERSGALKAGMTVIEPTSGNTGIGISAISSAKGYKAVIVMPETMSAERRAIISAYGAEIVLTDGADGMNGAIKKAVELSERRGGIILGQFTNPANPEAHKQTTGVEIWEDTQGKIDILVAGVGTGGTVTGAGEYLKSKNPRIKVVAVEPASSPVLSGGKAGNHKIQGIGAGFVPEILNTAVYDEVIKVESKDAFSTAMEVCRTDGVFVGISSGAVLNSAVQLALRAENAGKNTVVIFPDSGDRYLSLLTNT